MTIQEKPIAEPEWASNPPAGPPSTIVEPSAAQRAKGWGAQIVQTQTIPDPPVRQYFNWWQNLVYKWVRWLNRVTFKFDIFGPDQPLPVPQVLPSTGAGLSINAGEFYGAVITDGHQIQESGPNSNYSYTATSDTYWDLHLDGTWIPAVVAVAAPQPAIPTDAQRVFKVTTNATDRVASIYMGNTTMNIDTPLDLLRVVIGNDLTSTVAERLTERIRIAALGSGKVKAISLDSLQVYTDYGTSGVSGRSLGGMIVSNAFFSSTDSLWHTLDGTNDSWAISFSREDWLVLYHDVDDGTTWANSLGAPNWQRKLGADGTATFLDDDAFTQSISATGSIQSSTSVVAGTDVIAGAQVIGGNGVTASTGNVTASVGDVVAGDDVIAGDTVLAANNITSSNGNLIGQSIRPNLATEAPPAAHALYQSNVPKAWGAFEIGAAGTIASAQGFNIDFSVTLVDIAGPSTGSLRVVLDTPLSSAAYTVVATNGRIPPGDTPPGGTSGGQFLSVGIVDATTFLVHMFDPTTGAKLDLTLTGVGNIIMFTVFGNQ